MKAKVAGYKGNKASRCTKDAMALPIGSRQDEEKLTFRELASCEELSIYHQLRVTYCDHLSVSLFGVGDELKLKRQSQLCFRQHSADTEEKQGENFFPSCAALNVQLQNGSFSSNWKLHSARYA